MRLRTATVLVIRSCSVRMRYTEDSDTKYFPVAVYRAEVCDFGPMLHFLVRTRNYAGTMSSRSDTSSPIQCRQPPQTQVRLLGSITSSMRGRCLGSAPRLIARGLMVRLAAEASASSSAWTTAIVASRSSSASSN